MSETELSLDLPLLLSHCYNKTRVLPDFPGKRQKSNVMNEI